MSLRDEITQGLVDTLQGQELVRALQRALNNEFQDIAKTPTVTPRKRKRVPKIEEPPRHIVIPDTQVGPGVSTVHLEWIGQYLVDEFADEDVTLVHLGDHWDMPSLSSYDRGKARMEGKRIVRDIVAGNQGFDLLNGPIAAHNVGKRNKWNPRRVLLLGNHEDRITRAAQETPQLDGLLTLDLLNAAAWGWEVHDFREVVEIDGVAYSHYFYNPLSGRPYAGQNIDTRLKTIGRSFTMGHQQIQMYGVRTLPTGERHHGLVAGACYLHDEEYRGPQGNAEWRGIVVCNQVEHGSYDPMFVSLDYLARRYEGMRLKEFVARYVEAA